MAIDPDDQRIDILMRQRQKEGVYSSHIPTDDELHLFGIVPGSPFNLVALLYVVQARLPTNTNLEAAFWSLNMQNSTSTDPEERRQELLTKRGVKKTLASQMELLHQEHRGFIEIVSKYREVLAR